MVQIHARHYFKKGKGKVVMSIEYILHVLELLLLCRANGMGREEGDKVLGILEKLVEGLDKTT